MNTNWDACFSHLIKHEGGYVNHPSDPGGRTNLGITQAVWENWVDRPVTEEEMKALTKDMVKPLYKDLYWERVKGDKLPSGVDYCVFDAAVNSGVRRASQWLQSALGVTADGSIGPQTLAIASVTSPATIITNFSAQRLKFLQGLSTWPTFGKGWERRVNEVKATALSM
jgi:lysozyme family protein